MQPTDDQLARAESLIAITPDFPQPGVLFRDIGPMLADADALRAVTDALAAPFTAEDGTAAFDLVAGVEARGFLLAGAAAVATRTGALPIRKAGKTPRPTASVDYALEYGVATIEASGDLTGRRVLWSTTCSPRAARCVRPRSWSSGSAARSPASRWCSS